MQARTDEDFHGLALTQTVSVPPGGSATIEYDLVRNAAVQVTNGDIRYRLLLRPQPTVNPDRLSIAVSAPANWRFVQLPPGFAFGLILLLAAPAALAAGLPAQSCQLGRRTARRPIGAGINVAPAEDSLAGTGLNTSVELGLAAA